MQLLGPVVQLLVGLSYLQQKNKLENKKWQEYLYYKKLFCLHYKKLKKNKKIVFLLKSHKKNAPPKKTNYSYFYIN